MCQSHMEAPAVAGTTVGTETREEIGAVWSGGYTFRFGRRPRMVLDLVLGMGLWLVLLLLDRVIVRIRNGAGCGAGCAMAEDRFVTVTKRNEYRY